MRSTVILRAFLAFAALLPALTTGCVQLSPWEVAGGGAAIWQAEIDGNVASEISTGILGNPISLDSVLDLDQSEPTTIYSGSVQIAGLWLEGNYLNTQYDQTSTLDTTIDFLGQSFTVGTPVDAQFDFELATAKLKFGLLETPGVRWIPQLQVGALVGATYLGIESEISSLSPVVTVSDRIQGATPTVGGTVAAKWPLAESLQVFADLEVAGMSIDYEEYDGEYLDGRLRLGLAGDIFAVGVGYQFYDIDFRDDEIRTDFTADGLLLFGEIGF